MVLVGLGKFISEFEAVEIVSSMDI